MIPTKPKAFTHEGAPVGVEVKFYSQWSSRPMLSAPARIAAVHTNAASKEGSVDSASAWSERNVSDPAGSYTIPHYQVDRDGRARKMLPSNRRGICNATVLPGTKTWGTLTAAQQLEVMRYPVNVSNFSLAIETADTGTILDPTISDFTPIQAEVVATILAYETLVPGNALPLIVPTDWFGSGVGSHTDPFPFPLWTVQRGKICPGAKKKQSVRTLIIPRAVTIRDAWTAPPEEDDDDMTPEQAKQLDEVHKALHANDYPYPGMVNARTQIDRTYTIMSAFWDGAPGTIKDGAGVLARTIKNIAAKVGAKVG
jgi:hypothetical protein